jgi:hypothetical protein
MRRNRSFIGALLGTILLVAVIGGAAYMAYQAGFANGALADGAALSGTLTTADGETVITRGYHPYWGHGFFGIGRLFFGFFFFMLFFGVLKRMIFFPMMWAGRGRGYGPGRWKGPWGYDHPDEENESAEDAPPEKSV